MVDSYEMDHSPISYVEHQEVCGLKPAIVSEISYLSDFHYVLLIGAQCTP